MKSILDIFLQEQGSTRYDVAKKTTITEAALSKANRRAPETYTVKTIAQIAKGIGWSPGEVVDRLYAIEADETCLYRVSTVAELKQRIREKESMFYVENDCQELLHEVKKETFSESVELSIQLGTRGSGMTEVWFLQRLLTLLGPASKRDRENLKQSISTLYNIEFIDQTTAKLTLKQVDY